MTTEEIINMLADASTVRLDPEELGQIVRAVWERWAIKQPDCKPEWVTPWEELPERMREVDRNIGEAVELRVRLHIAALIGSPLITAAPQKQTNIQVNNNYDRDRDMED